MIDVVPFFLRVTVISVAVCFVRLLKRASDASMALLVGPSRATSSPPPPPPPSSSPWAVRHVPPRNGESSRPKLEFSLSFRSQQRENMAKMGIRKLSEFSPVKMVVAGTDIDHVKRPRKRPARLIVPASCPGLDLVDNVKRMDYVKDFEVIKGRDFALASKKGRREVMEDRHAAVPDIFGDPKQAFFAVIDGHGGHLAADYVAKNLGRNVVNELQGAGKTDNQVEAALRGGYSSTDKQFLAQDIGGGACAAGVLLKDGELHTANVGDCRVVLSRKGRAVTLTNDHRLSREDERARIENSGGFLHNHNGIWRVNGTLAVSRAFGDLHLKDWIICEPEIAKLPLTSECEFLIMASDGLWDKVCNQEAVDVVSRGTNLSESCRKLIDMSSSRGNRDDITVMTINLENFKKLSS